MGILQVAVDDAKVEQLYLDAIARKIELVDAELVYWDTNQLKRRTCMCWNTIQENFFYDENFPKAKVGGKWYYPAKETELFLQKWLSEKMKS